MLHSVSWRERKEGPICLGILTGKANFYSNRPQPKVFKGIIYDLGRLSKGHRAKNAWDSVA